MHTWTEREWRIWYQQVGRKPIAHLSKLQRKRLVRGCVGKVVYDSHEEARRVVESPPPIEGKGAGSYKCPLCHGVHVGNSTSRKDAPRMSTTTLTLQETAQLVQRDVKEQLEAFFASLPELNSLVSMGTALVEQSKAITVFRRDQIGTILVADGQAFLKATEQVQALKSVVEQMEELYEPFGAALFKAHRTVTGLRAGNVADLNAEIKRLKLEREQYAAEEDRKARAAAQAAAEDARKVEEARLIEEARQAAAEGNAAQAEAILEEAANVEAPPVIVQSTVPVAQGLSFREVPEWALLDIRKLKPEYLTVNEKAIGALVRSQRKAAEAMVGVGAIAVTIRKIPIDR